MSNQLIIEKIRREGLPPDIILKIQQDLSIMCAECGKELTSKQLKNNNTYCGLSCANTGKNNPAYGRHINSNENHGMWTGDDVRYDAVHVWVNRHKPKPSDGKCEVCHLVPYYDLANVTGLYNREFSNYQYLCRKCHRSIYHSGENSHSYGKPKSLKTIKKLSAAIKKGYRSGRIVWNKGLRTSKKQSILQNDLNKRVVYI